MKLQRKLFGSRSSLWNLRWYERHCLLFAPYCDNSGVVAQFKEPRNHGKGKHVERKYHLIQDIVQRGDVTVTKIATVDNLADLFTIALPQKVFERHLDSLGFRCSSNEL